MFIQTILSNFKPKPTTHLFWKGLDVFMLSDTAEKHIEVVCLFQQLAVILWVRVYVNATASVIAM